MAQRIKKHRCAPHFPDRTDDIVTSPASAFDIATRVTRAEGGGWLADLSADWDLGKDILNGGYLLAVVARAAVLDSPHPHPVALSASFLRPASAGPAAVQVTPGPAGRTLAHSAVSLTDETGPLVTAQVTTATLTAEPPTLSVAPPDATPLDQCLSMAENAPVALPGTELPGMLRQVDVRLDPATAGWAFGKPSGEPVHRAWARFADDREPDPLALIAFADILPPVGFALGRLGWAPTVQIQVLLRALPAPGWCLIESRGGQINDGWIDEDYLIWDSTGRLVAQSRQLARMAR